mmetsp:Transcript_33230/g.48799  ORF Transcript_33230/g.48799 Transcript_33230/m.48799 type:complete len:96 (-) Transcript_33230:114-401(-)
MVINYFLKREQEFKIILNNTPTAKSLLASLATESCNMALIMSQWNINNNCSAKIILSATLNFTSKIIIDRFFHSDSANKKLHKCVHCLTLSFSSK